MLARVSRLPDYLSSKFQLLFELSSILSIISKVTGIDKSKRAAAKSVTHEYPLVDVSESRKSNFAAVELDVHMYISA